MMSEGLCNVSTLPAHIFIKYIFHDFIHLLFRFGEKQSYACHDQATPLLKIIKPERKKCQVYSNIAFDEYKRYTTRDFVWGPRWPLRKEPPSSDLTPV